MLWIALAALPPIASACVWVGHHLHVRVAPPTVARLISAVLLASGAALIVRTL